MGWAEKKNPNSEYNQKRKKGVFMGTAEKAALKRLGRGIFGLIISGVAWFITNNPASMVISPIINALGKFLRAKFRIPNVPF